MWLALGMNVLCSPTGFHSDFLGLCNFFFIRLERQGPPPRAPRHFFALHPGPGTQWLLYAIGVAAIMLLDEDSTTALPQRASCLALVPLGPAAALCLYCCLRDTCMPQTQASPCKPRSQNMGGESSAGGSTVEGSTKPVEGGQPKASGVRRRTGRRGG